MTQVSAKQKFCGLCNRWLGDAKLSSAGVKGSVKMDSRARGTCAIRGGQNFSANDGTACSQFEISEKARAFN